MHLIEESSSPANDPDLRELRRIRLSQLPLLVGRSGHCQRRLAHASISPEHARLARAWQSFEVISLDLMNPVLVNGEAVAKRTLSGGDVVKMGPYQFKVLACDRPDVNPSTEHNGLASLLQRSSSKSDVAGIPNVWWLIFAGLMMGGAVVAAAVIYVLSLQSS